MNSYKSVNLFSLLLLFIAGLSCNSSEKPVTPQEAKDFARQLQISIEKRDGDFFDNAIDKQKLLKKAGLPNEKDARSFSSGLTQKMNIGHQLITSMSKKGTYELVKQYEKDKKQHLLFRLYDDGRLNYHDIELAKSGKETTIADMFIYTSGELFSETVHTMYTQMKKVVTKADMEDNWIMQMPRIRSLMSEDKYEEAMELYEKMPEKIKKLRTMQILHIMIGSGLDDEEKYEAAIDEYVRLYPNEPNMHLLLIDGYIMKKQYDKALYSVNEMDKMINKDPFLDYYRGLLYNMKEDKDSARISMERLMKNMKNFEDGMLEIINLYIKEGNNAEADKWIKEFRLHSSFDKDMLKTVLLLNGYTSPETEK